MAMKDSYCSLRVNKTTPRLNSVSENLMMSNERKPLLLGARRETQQELMSCSYSSLERRPLPGIWWILMIKPGFSLLT